MYVSPFWCGVVATIIAEFVFMNLIAILCGKNNREDERDGERNFEDN